MKKDSRQMLEHEIPQSADSGKIEAAGLIRIHEDVIATIARRAACSVEGVSRIAGNSIVNNLAEIVGSKRIHDRSIQIEMGDSSVSLEIAINIYFGSKLPVVASAVQEAVTAEITRLTGLKVNRINIVVREIEEPREKI